MFSATFPRSARELARRYLADDHIRIKIGRVGSTTTNIQQLVLYTDEDLKSVAKLKTQTSVVKEHF